MYQLYALLLSIAAASSAAQDAPGQASVSPAPSSSYFEPGMGVVRHLELECAANGSRKVGDEVFQIRETYFISISDMGPEAEKRMLIKVRGKTLVEEVFFSWSFKGEETNAIVDRRGWNFVTANEPIRRIKTIDIDRQVGTFKMTRGDFGEQPPKFISVSGPCKKADPPANAF